MTDAPAAIKGTFSDFKIIRGRKVAQLVIEIPLEEADAALTVLGGLPRPDTERWLAIARLDTAKAQEPPAREKRAFCDLPYPQQAALMCNNPTFVNWLKTRWNDGLGRLPEDVIRRICGVTSRKDILPKTEAGDRWIRLLREFEGQNG